MNPRNFFAELKRRNVYKVAIAYAVVGWLVMQVAATVVPALHLSDTITSAVVLLTLLGFPIALLLAWAFELTPEGLQRTETAESLPERKRSHAWIYIVMIGAALSVGLFFLGRYSGARQSSTGSGAPDKSIAVLPFESLSEVKTNAYFASGIQDEILTRLAKIGDLKVISRTSTEQYQSKPGKVSAIARELGVAHILEGSVQKAGEMVRVNVQLIKAEGDTHLWADTYDRKLTDIFAVETEVAQRIAASLEAQLTGVERQQIAAVPTKNPQAYDAYLRALELIKRQPFEDVRKGRDFLRQAVALDPAYAQAWAQIAIAESQLYYSVEHTEVCKERARAAAETAVRLQPELGEARAALGVYYYLCLQDYDRALLELQEALKNSPNDSTLLFYIGLVKRRQGRLDESIEGLRKAASSDPRNQDIWVNLGRSYRGKRDFPAAREMFDRAFVLSPDEAEFMGDKAETYYAEGNLEAAEKIVRDPKLAGKNGTLGEVVSLLTFRRQFEEALAAASQGIAGGGERAPFAVAEDKLWLGSLHYFAGHRAEARSIVEQAQRELLALESAGDTNPRVADALLIAQAALGDEAAVERQAAALLSATEHDAWRLPELKENVAIAYAVLGDADRAIPVIEDCLGAVYRRSLTPALLRLDPVWDRIRDDPRFQKLVKRAN